MDETFPCPKCGQILTRPQHAVSMQCPACKNFIIIPNRQTSDSPDPFYRANFDPTASMYGRSQAPAVTNLPSAKTPKPETLQTMVLLMLAGGKRDEAIKTYMRMTNANPERAAAEVDAIARMGTSQQWGGTPVTLERMRKIRQMIMLVSFFIILAFGLFAAFVIMK
jgi:hypothetical protein